MRTNTDTDRLVWLLKHLTYMEHTDKNGAACWKQPVGGYWPQKADDDTAFPEFDGLSLVEYIDAQISASCPVCHGTGDTGSGYLDCPHCDAAETKVAA